MSVIAVTVIIITLLEQTCGSKGSGSRDMSLDRGLRVEVLRKGHTGILSKNKNLKVEVERSDVNSDSDPKPSVNDDETQEHIKDKLDQRLGDDEPIDPKMKSNADNKDTVPESVTNDKTEDNGSEEFDYREIGQGPNDSTSYSRYINYKDYVDQLETILRKFREKQIQNELDTAKRYAEMSGKQVELNESLIKSLSEKAQSDLSHFLSEKASRYISEISMIDL